uniref:Complement factor properdin n=1 Tax=Salarias fasciatus TaxID=181472 RepID=A0A672F1L8_SALFA
VCVCVCLCLCLCVSVSVSVSVSVYGVRCFAHFNVTSGVCDEELGEVGKDSCCQNPAYGYLATDGVCQFCGPSVWSPWSSWSPCNVLCGDGVRQRRMKCFSINQSECENDRLQTEPCSGTCCDAGWRPWTDWSHCSVTCGGLGLRKRERVCSSSPECLSSCSGPSEETQACEVTSACPVHGGWSLWSGWSSCSASCIDDRRRGVPVPTRQRRRSCSDPAPSTDTPVPGNRCPGDDSELQDCSELPNCPVDGHWGAWSPPGPCSVTCGAGLQLSNRKCDSPTPKHGGRYCEGQSSQTSVCESPCPVDGFWSGWTVWTECSSPCVPDAGASVRIRRRSCTNPAPSANPPGGGCHGDDSQREDCVQLPPCPVDGAWGSWSEFSPCPVTCGFGRQTRERFCLHRDHGGAICSGDLQDRRHCYDVQGCLGESSLTSDLRTQTP